MFVCIYLARERQHPVMMHTYRRSSFVIQNSSAVRRLYSNYSPSLAGRWQDSELSEPCYITPMRLIPRRAECVAEQRDPPSPYKNTSLILVGCSFKKKKGRATASTHFMDRVALLYCPSLSALPDGNHLHLIFIFYSFLLPRFF